VFLGKGLIVKIFATKVGTTHHYLENGKHQVVTVLKLKKTVVAKFKNKKKDGYDAIVLVQDNEKAKIKKSVQGAFKNLSPSKIIEEKTEIEGKKVGEEYTIDSLNETDKINILSKSKGKGFQGTIKRHNFNTGPKTHGSRNYRRPGSIGMTTPSRVPLGKKMAGHMGDDRITLRNVKIEKIDKKLNTIWVAGHVPGANKSSIVVIK